MKRIRSTIFCVATFASMTLLLLACGEDEPLDETDTQEQCEGLASYTIYGSVVSYEDACTDVLTNFNGVATITITGGANNSVIATTQTNSSGDFQVTISGDVFEQYDLLNESSLDAYATYSTTDCDGDPYTYDGDSDGDLSIDCDWTIGDITME